MDLNTQVRDVASTRDDMTEHNNITKAHTAIVNEIATLNMQLQSVRGKARRPLSDKKEHLCEGTLPEFISSLEMWSTQSVSKRKKELQKIVSRPREVLAH